MVMEIDVKDEGKRRREKRIMHLIGMWSIEN